MWLTDLKIVLPDRVMEGGAFVRKTLCTKCIKALAKA